MLRGILVMGALSTVLPVGACANNVGVTPVAQGTQARVTEAGSIVAKDRAGWDDLWMRLGQTPPAGGLPDGKMAVAVTLGQKRTGGYSVAIIDAQEEAGQLVVHYRVHSPGLTAMVPQVLTAPYAVALMPKTDKPVRAEKVK